MGIGFRLKSTACFNSHAPVGARFEVLDVFFRLLVSIHTPPWGRDAHLVDVAVRGEFQFTRPRGGAILAWSEYEYNVLFQFTRPRGGAMVEHHALDVVHGFNSHAPVGAR